MERNNDPAHVRVGINMGCADGISIAKHMATLSEVLAKVLNMSRVFIVTAPIIVQCFFIQRVHIGTWLLRLVTLYALIGGITFIAVPQQLYNGLGLAGFRWFFEMFYPDIARCNGSLTDSAELGGTPLLGGRKVNELGGTRARLRWHGTNPNRFLCITHDGWAVAGDEKVATTYSFHYVFSKEKRVPDTYTLKVAEPDFLWHQAYLSFKPINHLRFGGWLGAYRDQQKASPYKVVQDSSCPPGTFKLICAWTSIAPPAQRYCSGLYVAEQLCGNQLYVGHACDRDAALFELEAIS